MQDDRQKEQAIRIYLQPDAEELSNQQLENLFWISEGRGFFVQGKIQGELAAKALRFLEQWLPVKEIEEVKLVEFQKAEEVFYLYPVISVRQIGKIQLGNSRLFARQLRGELVAVADQKKA